MLHIRLFVAAFSCLAIPLWSPVQAAEPPSSQACAQTSALRTIKDAAQRIGCIGASRQLWIVGEIHGTREIPQLVEALVAQEAATGKVTLALEIPSFEQPALDTYLASPGSLADVQRWLATPFWSAGVRDGRSSQAMLQLIDQVRRWRERGRRIDIVLTEPDYDQKAIEKAGSPLALKEQGMAQAIRRALTQDGRVVALMGNFHARYGDLGTITGMNITSPSAVEQLSELSPLLVWMSAAKGQAWTCQGDDDCRAHKAGEGDAISHPQLDVAVSPSSQIEIVKLRLPTFTPSLPATKTK